MKYTYRSTELKNVAKFNEPSSFDILFEERWNQIHSEEGVFRYKLEIIKRKVLEGQFNFLFELNIDRHVNRRQPDVIMSVNQPFDLEKFNFNKAKCSEYLFELQNLDEDDGKHMVLINTSPICFGHSLFCPDIDKFLPQIITLKSLKLALHIMFLSNNRDLRVGFNSLCGMASVNHLHYHILIVNHRLPVEDNECRHIKGPLFVMENYPAKCFCFQVEDNEKTIEVCENIYKLINYLIENNIAHNLYMIKGKALDGSDKRIVRVLVWVRTNSLGAKQTSAFNLAICEFSGQFPVKNQQDFDTLIENDIIEILDQTISPVYDAVLQNVINLY